MSHTIFKTKKFVEVSDGRVLPFCEYADSNVYEDSYSRKRPSWWTVYNLGIPKLLISKKEFAQKAKEMYEEQIVLLNDYNAKYATTEAVEDVGPESYNYYGTAYPGGRRLKNMRAFNSMKHTIPVQKFIEENPYVQVKLEVFNPKTHERYESVLISFKSEQDFYNLESEYQRLRVEYPDSTGVCVYVTGF